MNELRALLLGDWPGGQLGGLSLSALIFGFSAGLSALIALLITVSELTLSRKLVPGWFDEGVRLVPPVVLVLGLQQLAPGQGLLRAAGGGFTIYAFVYFFPIFRSTNRQLDRQTVRQIYVAAGSVWRSASVLFREMLAIKSREISSVTSHIFKDTSMLALVGVNELASQQGALVSSRIRPADRLGVYLTAVALYVGVGLTIEGICRRLGRMRR